MKSEAEIKEKAIELIEQIQEERKLKRILELVSYLSHKN